MIKSKLMISLLAALLLLLPMVALAQQEQGGGKPETVCIQCHGSQTGRLGEPVKLWKTSVHAANGISCNDCHGGDPTDFGMAMSPDRGFLGAPKPKDIPAFCGRCHIGVKEDYLASKHGQALGKGGPQCVTCHTNHAVQPASLALINKKTCTQCHTFERAAQIREALAGTDGMINGLEKDLDQLHRVGIAVKTMKGKVFSLRNRFHRLFHTVDVTKVKDETAKFQSELGKVGKEIDTIKAQLHQRKLWGGVAVALLVLAGIVFILLRRTYHEEESQS